MKIDRSNCFAFLLIGCGALILLNKAGFHFGNVFGHIMGYLFPAAMAALGYIGVRNGSRFFGWLLMVIGGIVLFGKLSWMIGLILAIGMIAYGVSMLTKRNATH